MEIYLPVAPVEAMIRACQKFKILPPPPPPSPLSTPPIVADAADGLATRRRFSKSNTAHAPPYPLTEQSHRMTGGCRAWMIGSFVAPNERRIAFRTRLAHIPPDDYTTPLIFFRIFQPASTSCSSPYVTNAAASAAAGAAPH